MGPKAKPPSMQPKVMTDAAKPAVELSPAPASAMNIATKNCRVKKTREAKKTWTVKGMTGFHHPALTVSAPAAWPSVSETDAGGKLGTQKSTMKKMGIAMR